MGRFDAFASAGRSGRVTQHSRLFLLSLDGHGADRVGPQLFDTFVLGGWLLGQGTKEDDAGRGDLRCALQLQAVLQVDHERRVYEHQR